MAMLPCNRFMGGAGDMVHHSAPFSQRLHSSCRLLLFFYHYHYKGCTNFTTDALQLEMKTEHLRLSLLLENYPLERDWIGWENIYLHLHIEDPAHLIPQPFVFAIKPSILLQMVTVQLIGLFSAQ